MDFLRKDINKTKRNGLLIVSASSNVYNSGGGSVALGSYLPAIDNGDGSYTVDITKVLFNGNILATGDVASYINNGEDIEEGTTVIVYDGLDSSDKGAALSANQGRILKLLIDSTSIQIENNYKDYISKNYYNKDLISDLLKVNNDSLVEHINDELLHTTELEKTDWTLAYNNLKRLTDWFYTDAEGRLHCRLHFIGEGDILSYGDITEEMDGNFGVAVIDRLDSTDPTVALSANQGRVLNNKINNSITDYTLLKDIVNGNFNSYSELGLVENLDSDGLTISLNKKTNTAEKISVTIPIFDILETGSVGLVNETFIDDIREIINESLVNFSGTVVEDTFTSTSKTTALSANKGRELKLIIGDWNFEDNITNTIGNIDEILTVIIG